MQNPEYCIFKILNLYFLCFKYLKNKKYFFSLLYQTLDSVVNMYGCDSVYLVGLDLIAAFYGCLYAGCIPITVRPPHPQNIPTTLPTVKMIVEVNTQTDIFIS